MVQDHRQNELYASTWIDLIIHHTCNSVDENDVSSELLLSTLLDSNDRLLDEVITVDTVRLFENLVVTKVRSAETTCALATATAACAKGLVLPQA